MCGRFVGNYSINDLLGEIKSVGDGVSMAIDNDVLSLFSPVRTVSHTTDVNSGETEEDGRDESTDVRRWSNFNVAPSTRVPVLVLPPEEEHSYCLTAMTWGFVPSWSKEPRSGRAMINARSETVLEKPSFRSDIVVHRCLVPMSGFYEWDRTHGTKRPYFVSRSDGRTMWCLGLWGSPSYGEGLGTCALLTRESSGRLAEIHDRAPVQTTIEDALDWLAPGPVPLELCDMEHQCTLVAHEVSPRVNSVRNNDASLLEHVEQTTLFD